MEWIENLNKAVQYLEEHLIGDIDYEQAAKIAGCSTYHFVRMFGYLANMPLGEYIRRRRMSLAAAELRSGEGKILDIALKYGYTSPTAFNRAFQNVHGIAPSAAKKENASLKAYGPITFQVTVTGMQELEYRIQKLDAFRILGVSRPLAMELEENFAVVPQLWQQAAMDGTIPRLAANMDSQPMGLLGVSACNNDESWRYFIAVSSSQPVQDDLEEYLVPAFTWAVFEGDGACPQAIQKLEQKIITQWLPTSGYEYDNGPDIEVYLNPDPQNAKFQVWIPVVKR